MRIRSWFTVSLVGLLAASYVNATIVYKDATSPNGIPDFQQKPGKGVCWEVAVTNCLWYWDHHGHASLIPHTNGDPGDWEKDGDGVINLINILARGVKIFGITLVKPRGCLAAQDYIKFRGKHWIKGKQAGLHVKEYYYCKATYSLFHQELSRCQDVIPYFKAHKAGGGEGEWLEVGEGNKKHEWYHAQTAAGWDDATPPTKVATTNGWRNNNGQVGDNDNVVHEDNYEISDIQNPATSGDKLRVTDNPQNGIPPAGSDYIEMVAMMTICPLNKDGTARTVIGTAQPKPGEPPMMEYSYCLKNHTDSSLTNEPVSALGISIEVPFTFDHLDVQSPAGWTAVEWIPVFTPGLAPTAPFLDPDDPNAIDTTVPEWRGVLWTTSTNPVSPGDTLCGFSFELPDLYPIADDASRTAMSSTVEDTSRILDHGFTIGPLPPSVCDAIGPDQGLTFTWYQDGEMMEVEWYYRYLVDDAEGAAYESHFGKLDFRAKHPEHDGKGVQFNFFRPPGQSGWRQTIFSYPSGGVSDVYTVGDYPGEWHIPDIAALLGSDCSDTIFTAVDLNLYGASNPNGFGEPGGSVGKNLSGLGVIIVDGQVEGLEGIYWATSEWTLDTTGRSIFKPIGGVGTLLNSADCPDDLVVVAEHVGGMLDDGTVCCVGTRGNVDGDADDNVNVADLTYLVNYIFAGGSPPPCWEEADIDGDDSINVADVTSLVDYIFFSGPAPLSCP